MKKLMLLLVLSSCANFKDVTTFKSEEGYVKYKRFKNSHLLPRALRDSEGNLVKNEDEAKQELKRIGSLDNLYSSTPNFCKLDFELTKQYQSIIEKLKNKNTEDALREIESFKVHCLYADQISHISYLEAYAYQLKKDKKARDEKLNQFLKKAEYIFPHHNYQENTLKEKSKIYNSYTAHAKDVLSGKTELILIKVDKEHLEIPRYRDLTNSLLPGFKTETGRTLLIVPGYGSITKATLSAVYNITTDYGEFAPIFTYSSKFGSIGALVYRKQLSQTLDRKHQTGLNLNLHQWRKYTYKKTAFNSISDVKVVDSGIGGRIGYGGTYQFNNRFQFVYQGSYSSNYENNLAGTTLIGYAFAPELQLQAGMLNDHSAIALKFSSLYFVWDFSSQTFSFNMIGGLQF